MWEARARRRPSRWAPGSWRVQAALAAGASACGAAVQWECSLGGSCTGSQSNRKQQRSAATGSERVAGSERVGRCAAAARSCQPIQGTAWPLCIVPNAAHEHWPPVCDWEVWEWAGPSQNPNVGKRACGAAGPLSPTSMASVDRRAIGSGAREAWGAPRQTHLRCHARLGADRGTISRAASSLGRHPALTSAIRRASPAPGAAPGVAVPTRAQ